MASGFFALLKTTLQQALAKNTNLLAFVRITVIGSFHTKLT